MKAQFIGADKSMGLQRGKIYYLNVSISEDKEQVWVEGYHDSRDAFVHDITEAFFCPYDNMNGFLRNWRPLVFDKINGSFVYDK